LKVTGFYVRYKSTSMWEIVRGRPSDKHCS